MGNDRNNGKGAGDGVPAAQEPNRHPPQLHDLGHLEQTMGADEELDCAADDAEEDDESGSELDPKTQAHIGGLLRQLYDELLDEPIPTKLVELLKELEHSEKQEREE